MAKAKFFLKFSDLFTTNGRISRLQYFAYSTSYVLIYFAFYFAASLTLTSLGYNIDDAESTVVSLPTDVILLSFCFVFVCLTAKRMHDLGWATWLAIVMFIDIPLDMLVELISSYRHLPEFITQAHQGIDTVWRFVGGIIGIGLTFGRGMTGTNKYGPNPLKPVETDISVF